MRTPILALLLSVLVPDRSASQSMLPLWNGLEAGQFGIGFRQLKGERTRVDVWYPSADTGSRMTYSLYLGDASASLTKFLRSTGISDTTIDSLLKSPLAAIAQGRPLIRAFPLVLLAQGNRQDAADQAVLAEFLASHGYVVASTPSPMLKAPMERESQIGQFAEEHAADLAVTSAVVARSIPVDTSRLFLVGHSFGARSALLMSMRDQRGGAIVSLDGGIGTATGISELRAASSFRADARVSAILHVYEELDPFMTPDLTFLRSLRTDTLLLVRAHAMRHVHFTTYGFASSVFPEIARVTRATEGTAADVRAIAVRVLDFLRSR